MNMKKSRLEREVRLVVLGKHKRFDKYFKVRR